MDPTFRLAIEISAERSAKRQKSYSGSQKPTYIHGGFCQIDGFSKPTNAVAPVVARTY
jgi:hypothetical protein